jgi:DNA-binding MarR family transcriptional regulator
LFVNAPVTIARTANLLGALSAAINERAAVAFGEHPNQTDTAVAALKLVADADGCSNGELAQALGLSHPATVRLLDRLEAAHLVQRAPAADRRAVAVHVTPEGKRRVRRALTARGQALQAVIATLDVERRDQLAAIASELLDALTTSPLEAAHVCRLCDSAHCPAITCPVHQRALAIAKGHTHAGPAGTSEGAP